MTVSELAERLSYMPADADVAYLHNVSGVISIDKLELRELKTINGKMFNLVVFSGAEESDENEA